MRAWRHATRTKDRREIDQLREQVQQLQAALQHTQDDSLCATAGCQIANQLPTKMPGSGPVRDANSANSVAWRSVEWNDPDVRVLRSRLTTATGEIDRLREENGLMRRWIQERLGVDASRNERHDTGRNEDRAAHHVDSPDKRR